MKHLFNDISREEKQRILEMHGVKKPLINEGVTNLAITDFCTACNEPENKCGQGKMSTDSINRFAATLGRILRGGGDKKGLLGLGGLNTAPVVDVFNQLSQYGNFHDFCALVNQYDTSNPFTLCNDLSSKVKERDMATIIEKLNLLYPNTVIPCKKQQTPIKKPVKKTTPIKKPVIQRPPITIPPRKGGETFLASN
jgi:hypothetical protein